MPVSLDVRCDTLLTTLRQRALREGDAWIRRVESEVAAARGELEARVAGLKRDISLEAAVREHEAAEGAGHGEDAHVSFDGSPFQKAELAELERLRTKFDARAEALARGAAAFRRLRADTVRRDRAIEAGVSVRVPTRGLVELVDSKHAAASVQVASVADALRADRQALLEYLGVDLCLLPDAQRALDGTDVDTAEGAGSSSAAASAPTAATGGGKDKEKDKGKGTGAAAPAAAPAATPAGPIASDLPLGARPPVGAVSPLGLGRPGNHSRRATDLVRPGGTYVLVLQPSTPADASTSASAGGVADDRRPGTSAVEGGAASFLPGKCYPLLVALPPAPPVSSVRTAAVREAANDASIAPADDAPPAEEAKPASARADAGKGAKKK